MRIVVLAVTAAALFAAPAEAGTWLVPRDGATRPASSWPNATPSEMTEFTVYWGDYASTPYDFDIEVATSPATDPDGTLANATVIDRYQALPRPGFDDIFGARTALDARWLATPGTYYWQAAYEEAGAIEALPVRSLTVTPATPPDPPQPRATPVPFVVSPPPAPVRPPLAASTARIVTRRAIAAGTHRVARGVVYRCVTAPGAATCRPSWRDARHRYSGTLRITAGAGGIAAAFSGTRTDRACARRCSRRVSWSAAM